MSRVPVEVKLEGHTFYAEKVIYEIGGIRCYPYYPKQKGEFYTRFFPWLQVQYVTEQDPAEIASQSALEAADIAAHEDAVA